MNDKKFKLSFEVGFVLDDSFDDAKMDMVMECLKDDIKRVLDKNSIFCSNFIHSKNINVVELDSSNLDDVGGD